MGRGLEILGLLASEELAAACFGRINATATARDLVNDRDRVVAVASHGRAAVTNPGWSLPRPRPRSRPRRSPLRATHHDTLDGPTAPVTFTATATARATAAAGGGTGDGRGGGGNSHFKQYKVNW